jgi:hypothetical protein
LNIIFYQLPLTPLSLVRHSGPSSGIRTDYGSLLTLTSLRYKDGVPGKGIGSSTLRWKKLPDVAKGMSSFVHGNGQILWDVT